MGEGAELEFTDRTKRIGILIAVIAAFLAFTEAAGSNAASDSLRGTVEASNTWAFFQAKTIRMTTLRAQADALELTSAEMQAGPAFELARGRCSSAFCWRRRPW